MGYNAGTLVQKTLSEYKNGAYANAPIQIICSPFIRTLQTAAYFANSINYTAPMLLNNNIVVKLGSGSSKVHSEGVLKSNG